MKERTRVSDGSHFENVVGYSRAVRVGDQVFVSGTTAAAPDGPIGGASLEGQTREVFRRIEAALSKAGASLSDVVRTRFFVVDIGDWETLGRIHSSLFKDVLPANTLVEVSALADPSLLVEVEVDAVVDSVDRPAG